MDAQVWVFLMLILSTSYSVLILGNMFYEAKHLDHFMPEILAL